jgi:hypothetical protein
MALIYFRISIDSTGLGGVAPSDGFIDPTAAEFYPTLCSNVDLAKAKERANFRWLEIVQRLSENLSLVRVDNFVKPGATADTPPSTFTFTIAYEKPNAVYTYDELNNGATLWNQACVKRQVARALTSYISSNTYMAGPQIVAGNVPEYTGILVVDAGPLADDLLTAENAITVELIDI